MALSETLARAHRDAASGNLGKARDRLEGLLRTYPDDLEIRQRLGDIYWRLQYPERAGQHWYLLPSESPEMDAAKDAFMRRFGDNAILMLEAINYRGGLDGIRDTFAETALRELAQRAHLSEASLESLLSKRVPGGPAHGSYEPGWAKYAGWAVVAVVVTFVVLALVGLMTAVKYVGGLLGW